MASPSRVITAALLLRGPPADSDRPPARLAGASHRLNEGEHRAPACFRRRNPSQPCSGGAIRAIRRRMWSHPDLGSSVGQAADEDPVDGLRGSQQELPLGAAPGDHVHRAGNDLSGSSSAPVSASTRSWTKGADPLTTMSMSMSMSMSNLDKREQQLRLRLRARARARAKARIRPIRRFFQNLSEALPGATEGPDRGPRHRPGGLESHPRLAHGVVRTL